MVIWNYKLIIISRCFWMGICMSCEVGDRPLCNKTDRNGSKRVMMMSVLLALLNHKMWDKNDDCFLDTTISFRMICLQFCGWIVITLILWLQIVVWKWSIIKTPSLLCFAEFPNSVPVIVNVNVNVNLESQPRTPTKMAVALGPSY